jgi:hypothetical protein
MARRGNPLVALAGLFPLETGQHELAFVNGFRPLRCTSVITGAKPPARLAAGTPLCGEGRGEEKEGLGI